MAEKQLGREAYMQFFTDVNKAMAVKAAITEEAGEKVTLAAVLKSNNIELDLPPDIMEKIRPGLEVDLNAPIEERSDYCAACAICAICTICAEANALSGLGGLVGTVGLA